jgi:hypothetical protein
MTRGPLEMSRLVARSQVSHNSASDRSLPYFEPDLDKLLTSSCFTAEFISRHEISHDHIQIRQASFLGFSSCRSLVGWPGDTCNLYWHETEEQAEGPVNGFLMTLGVQFVRIRGMSDTQSGNHLIPIDWM